MHSRLIPLSVLTLLVTACFGLAACRSSSETMDDDGMMNDGMNDRNEAMQVTTRGTIQVLQQGLTNVSVDAATNNIDGWQARMREANADGFADLIRDLETLEDELESGDIDNNATAQLLNDIGRQTIDAASMASGRAGDNIRELGETLVQGSRQLR